MLDFMSLGSVVKCNEKMAGFERDILYLALVCVFCRCFWFGVRGSGLNVQNSEFRVQCSGFNPCCAGFAVVKLNVIQIKHPMRVVMFANPIKNKQIDLWSF
jgi:hypothetical protein